MIIMKFRCRSPTFHFGVRVALGPCWQVERALLRVYSPPALYHRRRVHRGFIVANEPP